MGNREDLLDGARKAILERGLAKVTARDIAAAAGVSLAAIGYHFGSKDRLITEALTEGMGEDVGDRMEEVIRAADNDRPFAETIGPTWDGLCAILDDHHESMLLSMENLVRIARSDDDGQYLAAATEHAYDDLARALTDTHTALSPDQARALAKLLFALFQGAAVLRLTAPTASRLDGEDLSRAVAALRGY
ncbi:TetR family transcriptional regulator [Nocardia farcinica]|uniref:TetR/AcrR family transcriptional regulator n=1 Tax=Nocardia farcinica TaxID=37329 RepID=UPI000A3913D9|nr:TetR family transcriptional regulator [Nocardia farcinica]MBA4859279.1 TetR family transcriptional regulator [Nocardia farcinica]MBC9816446.1 TetR family transcriptional regulator [Nocardia farcinica]MBF6417532.1 TetR family transcriptional regulator [Nocardia farcinica]MBF6428962.1 TetR family transcriptional regulator [Nocardia farcinica]MBF6501892.1 TetR family transcriptional regulator [Nocardia farcinica]